MSGEKTEKPTAKKLREARRKGQVAVSKDLSSGMVFVTGFLMLAMTLPQFSPRLQQFMAFCFQEGMRSGAPAEVLAFGVLGRGGALILQICAPVFGAMFLIALFITFIQTGPIFTMEPLKPALNKLNPAEGFKKIFFQASPYVELLKSVIKITAVTALAWFLFTSNFRYIVQSARRPLNETTLLAGELLFKLCIQVSVLFLVIAAADFFFQKKQFEKKLMMSKEEVKQEHKQSEGDPHNKAQRKRVHRDILQHNMVEDVRKATVVVVNPRHIAVAIQYDREKMNAPQLTAKGEDLWALQIIEVARQFNVPVMRNVPLAHSLNELEIGDEIPEKLYEAMAEVLNWVYRMSQP